MSSIFERILGRGNEKEGLSILAENLIRYKPILYLGAKRSVYEEGEREPAVIEEFERLGFKIVEIAPGMDVTPRVQDIGFFADPSFFPQEARDKKLAPPTRFHPYSS